MQAAAKARVAPFPRVELKAGTADGIPAEDESFDKSVSLQVFEYIEDIGAALSEVWRVLKPGGLFVVADLHFDSWIWAADDTARMSRMMEAWGHHAVHWDLPARLPQAMRDAGFQVDRVLPFAMVDHVMEPDGYGALLLPLLSGYAVQNGLVVEDEAEAWVAEQHMMASEGRFFFSIMQVVIAGRKPG
jgi:SAM-dependent methyltransferase